MALGVTQADLDGFKAQIEAYTADETARDEKLQSALKSVLDDIHANIESGNTLDASGIASALSSLMQEHTESKPKEDDLFAQVDALKTAAPVTPEPGEVAPPVTSTVPDTSPVNPENGLP